MILTSSIVVERPPAEVWAFSATYPICPSGTAAIARAIETNASGARGVGTEFHTESPGNFADRGRMAYRVASVDEAAHRCTIDLTSSGGNARFFKRAQWIFEVTPAPPNARA